jgi:hypothetical protein
MVIFLDLPKAFRTVNTAHRNNMACRSLVFDLYQHVYCGSEDVGLAHYSNILARDHKTD